MAPEPPGSSSSERSATQDSRKGRSSVHRTRDLATLGFALLSLLVAEPPAGAADRPNVLFIVVDDLNDWVGVLGGHPQARTPNIDRLARRGVSFTRAYAAAAECNPSRTAVLTGFRPSTSGVYSNDDPWRKTMPDVVTLPRLFMNHGYRVVGGGKIFHRKFRDPASWHEYFDREPNPRPARRPVNGIPDAGDFDWGRVLVPDEEMADYQVVSWAVTELGRVHDEPFFLACGLFRPHLPWYVPSKYFDMFPLVGLRLPEILVSDLDDVPPAGVEMARPLVDHQLVIESRNYRRAVRGYLASIAFADAQVGRLLDALERSPQADHTIVVLWSDHGWHLGEKLHWRKFTLWEEATRAPLLVFAPGVTKPGGRSPRTVSFVDIYPTLADLAGLPIADDLDGVSLRPLLEDPDAAWDRPALMTQGLGNHAVRSERWRYIRYADGSEELYDHEADPLEWRNLAADPKLDSVKRELARWLPKTNAPPTGSLPDDQEASPDAQPD
jgi:arylsulfatase A-like enzyme